MAGGGAEDCGQVGRGGLGDGEDALAGIARWQRGMALAGVSAAAEDSGSLAGSAQPEKCGRCTSAQELGGYHTPLVTEVRTEEDSRLDATGCRYMGSGGQCDVELRRRRFD